MTWIKVTDQIPTEEQKVWYYFEQTGVNLGWFRKVRNDEFCSNAEFNCFWGPMGYLCDDVTHWMPYCEEKPERPLRN